MIFIIILIAVIFDPIRDAYIQVKPSINNRLWHIIKWIAYFTPLTYLCYDYIKDNNYSQISFLRVIVFSIICRFIWKYIYEFFRKRSNKNGRRNS